MRSSLKENVSRGVSIENAVLTADANGATIDRAGYEEVVLIAIFGESGDTLSGSVKVEMEVEHSDDGSTWADCAAADLIGDTAAGQFAVVDGAADDQQAYTCAYVGGKRYVRAVANFTGTHSNGIPLTVLHELGCPRAVPV